MEELNPLDLGLGDNELRIGERLPPCREDSSSSSSGLSVSPRKLEKRDKFPEKSTDWHLSHLFKIGIEYAENTTTLSDFFSSLKGKPELLRTGTTELPPLYSALCRKLAEISEEVWEFSVNMDKFIQCQTCVHKMGQSSTRDSMIVEQLDLIESAMKSFQHRKQEMRTGISDVRNNDAVET